MMTLNVLTLILVCERSSIGVKYGMLVMMIPGFASSMAVVEAFAPMFDVDRAYSILGKNVMVELF